MDRASLLGPRGRAVVREAEDAPWHGRQRYGMMYFTGRLPSSGNPSPSQQHSSEMCDLDTRLETARFCVEFRILTSFHLSEISL